MIQGYFSTREFQERPFIEAVFQFSVRDVALHDLTLEVPLLVDTGADRTILSPAVALQLELQYGVNLTRLPRGRPSSGVGGRAETRDIGGSITLGDRFKIEDHLFPIIEPPARGPIPTIPSLLGRDMLIAFGIVVHQRSGRVLLLERDEFSGLRLTSPLPEGNRGGD
jgi:hypothetical protein